MSHFRITGQRQDSNIRPVYLMCEEGVSNLQMQAVRDGINEMCRLACVDCRVEVKNFGIWRNHNYLKGNALTDWNSVDWYLLDAKRASTRARQVHGGQLMNRLLEEPWQKNLRHYDVFVLKSDMYDDRTNFVIGLAVRGYGTIVSVNRFLSLDKRLQCECVKTETMHEVGHVFGLIPEDRTENVEFSLGRHCTNRCIMRQGLRLPDDWIRMTRDRLEYGPLCQICQHDLRRFFH